MRPALEELNNLEAFMAGTLPEESRQETEIRLLWDRELQQKLTLQQIAYRALREAGREQLRQELKLIHASLYSS